MIKDIAGLYEQQKAIWKEENEHFFGVSPLDNWDNKEKVKAHLSKCVDEFWNNGSNEFKKLLENGKCRNYDQLIENPWELVFDSLNGIICLYATFNVIDENNPENIYQRRSPIAYFPYANDLCWFFGQSEYVLRISAVPNYSLLSRNKNIIKYQKTWVYDIDKDEFTINIDDFDPYENLTKLNRDFLECNFGKTITKDNFKEALKSIPEYSFNSIASFRFGHVSEIFKIVRNSNRFANPLTKVPIPINVVKMFTAQKNRNKDDDGKNDTFNNLILSTNKLYALENSRTVLYKSTFNTNFSFEDTNEFFDAFKTSTDKAAGRSRLLLDDVIIKDDILYNKINGEYHSMFDILKNKLVVNNNLSVLSCSRFSSSNAPKRIMMTAKLRAQAVPVIGEDDPFTHEVSARIVFGDFKGFNYGDAIIISRSFARKLKSHKEKKIRIDNYNYRDEISKNYKVGDQIPIELFTSIIGSTMCNNYRNIILKDINPDSNYMTIEADLPFSVGDKITNFHASKGIVSLILEDVDMPYLKNDISDNFKAGPFDIIISGLSVFRRKTLGQIFEAWALAMGIDDVDNIQDAIEKYENEMKDFSNKSIVCWNGHETIKPCGINKIIRLNHDSVTKQSHSYIKTNYAKMLKIGEQELLNISSRGLTDIMNEIDIRSVSKHYDSLNQIKNMQKNGYSRYELANNLRFFNLLKTIGFDFNLRNPIKNEDDINPEFLKLQELLTDNQINLFNEGDDK